MAVEEERHLGAGLDGIVVARVARAAPAPRRQEDPAGRPSTPAAPSPVEVVVRRLQHGRRRPRARSPPSARRCPTAWRSAGARSWASTRTGCCARPRSSSSRRGRRRDPRPARRRRRAGHADPRRARHRGRRALGPRDQPQPARRHVGRRRRPRPRRQATTCRSRCRRRRSPSSRRRRRRPTVEIDDPDLCGRFTPTVLRGVADRAVDRAGSPGRLTLLGMRPINNVVDVSNYVMLELGQPNHPYDLATVPGGVLGIRRARDGETLVTLDDVERRFTADDLLICDARRRAHRHRRDHGRRHDRDRRRHHRRARRDGVVPAAGGRRRRLARLGLRTEASARFEKGVDPEGIERAVGRFAELLGVAAATPTRRRRAASCPTRAPVRLRTRAGQPHPRHRRSRPTRSAPSSSRSASRCDAGRRRPRRHHPVVAPRLRGRGRPRRGGRPPLGLRPHRRRGAADGPLRPPHRAPAARAAGSASPWSGSGSSEAMPMAFLAPGDQARAGLGDDGITITNPLVAEESVLRTSLLPGPAQGRRPQRRPPPDRRRRCSRSATSSAGRPTPAPSCPTSASTSASPSPARRRPAPSQRWWALAEHLGLDADAARPRARPACTRRGRPRSSSTATVLGVVGEVDPGVLDGVRHRRAGGVARGRPRPPPRPPAVERAVRAVQPLPVERRRPRLRGARRRARGRRRGRHRRRRRRPARVGASRSTSTAAPASADGSRSLAYRLRFQAPDRTLTDAEVGEARAGGDRRRRGAPSGRRLRG